jgi:hypothetical protein
MQVKCMDTECKPWTPEPHELLCGAQQQRSVTHGSSLGLHKNTDLVQIKGAPCHFSFPCVTGADKHKPTRRRAGELRGHLSPLCISCLNIVCATWCCCRYHIKTETATVSPCCCTTNRRYTPPPYMPNCLQTPPRSSGNCSSPPPSIIMPTVVVFAVTTTALTTTKQHPTLPHVPYAFKKLLDPGTIW